MNAQQRAFDPGPALGNLTDRQACALTILQAHPEGLRSIDLGRELHIALATCRFCTPTVWCRFAHSSGEEVGKALRARGLARKPRGRWVSLVRPAAPPEVWPADFF